MTEAQRRWARENPARKREIDRAYYQRRGKSLRQAPAYRKKVKKIKARYRAKNPDVIREYRQRKKEHTRAGKLLSKYGLTVEMFNNMLNKQGGLCAICRAVLESGYRMHVDHDHETGAVRGILCNSCNMGLGKFKDSPLLLESALRYLRGIR